MPESAWLIESKVGGATVWMCENVWTNDPRIAIRFVRKEDAQAMITVVHRLVGGVPLTDWFPSEHVFH